MQGLVAILDLKDLHWPFQMCYKNTGRGTNDVDHYLPMIKCIVNVGMEGQMDRYADGWIDSQSVEWTNRRIAT